MTLTTWELQERKARRVLPKPVYDYFAGGSGEESTLAANGPAWLAHELRPAVLRDVSDVDTGTDLLGTHLRVPVLAAPTALHALAHPDGEVATAAGVGAAGSLLVLSSRTSVPIARVGAAAAGRPWWFQVYALRDRKVTDALIREAVAAGATTLVITVDAPVLGRRKQRSGGLDVLALHERSLRAQFPDLEFGPTSITQDPSITSTLIAELTARYELPVVVKGVLRGDEAIACVDAGAAGVIVSNHGGRQLDGAIATARALPEVVAAVQSRVPVLVDGGIRTGREVLTALGLGASAVLVGRPVIWALAADGARGVTAYIDAVRADLENLLALAGAASPRALPPHLVVGVRAPAG